jgi:hypothetical protein
MNRATSARRQPQSTAEPCSVRVAARSVGDGEAGYSADQVGGAGYRLLG